MKRIAEILIGLCLLLECMSCATSPRESAASESLEEAAITNSELDAQFTADHLSVERLEALEVRARQKLLDFADYVNLLSDPTLDSTFRKQAEEQARQLFVYPEATIALTREAVSLEDFFRELPQGEEAIGYSIQNMVVSQPFQQKSAQQYQGAMIFDQRVDQESTQQRKVTIWVKKVAKQFGSERKMVWEVFLGAIG